jgi:hypothetical protein
VNLHSSTGTPTAINWPLELFLIKPLKTFTIITLVQIVFRLNLYLSG